MFRSAIVVAGCVAAIFTLSVTAQQPLPGQKPPVFRSTLDLVHLDVSVLDKNRHPVRGLTAADFTIIDDGQPQDVAVFTAVDVPETPPKPAAWSGRTAADVQSNEGDSDPEGRLFVLLIDDAMIPPHAPSVQSAREVAKKVLDKVTPADRVAVVFSMSGRNQNFTNERAKLVQAIDSLKQGYATHLLGWDTAKPAGSPVFANMPPEIPGPAGDPDIPYRVASVQTLRMVAETLITAPQRRKALIYLSPGIDVDEASVAIPVKAGVEVDNSRSDANRKLFQDTSELFRRMQQANVTIYPVDPCGAGGFQSYLMGVASGPLKARDYEPNAITGENNPKMPTPITSTFNWLNPGFAVPTTDQFATHVSTITMSFLQSAAANTGGRAIINTNDFDTGLDQIFDENSSYYLLGYQQPAGQKPGSIHQLKVRVNRPDVMVRTRSGYATLDAPKKKNAPVASLSPLDAAIVNAVPDGSFPMRVALAPFVMPGKKDPVITIALGLAQPPVATRSIFAVDVQTNAYTGDGRPKFVGQRHTATVTIVPTKEKGLARYDLLTQISLPPGRYQLRLSANRTGDNVSGSLYADLDVPDFTARLSASGIIVEAVPTGPTAPMGAFDSFLPVVPSTSREFSRTQDVTAFMRIYQGGTGSAQPVEVRTRLVNESDAAVGSGKDMLYGTDFRVGGRAADYRFAIPTKSLPPGLYLLTFDIELDHTVVQRSVQFKITK